MGWGQSMGMQNPGMGMQNPGMGMQNPGMGYGMMPMYLWTIWNASWHDRNRVWNESWNAVSKTTINKDSCNNFLFCFVPMINLIYCQHWFL